MNHILITGVSRGIGLELLSQSLAKGDQVCGVARAPEESSELSALQKKYPEQLMIVKGDVNDPELGKKMLSALSLWKSLDLVIHNAGVYLSDSREDFQKTFLTNSVSPYLLTLDLLPLLKKSSLPRAAFISSQMGSVGENSSGGNVSYRSSKAALNMMVKSLSIDESWLTSLIFHPGWVKTRMGGGGAPVNPPDSAKGLLNLIHESGKKDSGTFRTFQGKILLW